MEPDEDHFNQFLASNDEFLAGLDAFTPEASQGDDPLAAALSTTTPSTSNAPPAAATSILQSVESEIASLKSRVDHLKEETSATNDDDPFAELGKPPTSSAPVGKDEGEDHSAQGETGEASPPEREAPTAATDPILDVNQDDEDEGDAFPTRGAFRKLSVQFKKNQVKPETKTDDANTPAAVPTPATKPHQEPAKAKESNVIETVSRLVGGDAKKIAQFKTLCGQFGTLRLDAWQFLQGLSAVVGKSNLGQVVHPVLEALPREDLRSTLRRTYQEFSRMSRQREANEAEGKAEAPKEGEDRDTKAYPDKPVSVADIFAEEDVSTSQDMFSSSTPTSKQQAKKLTVAQDVAVTPVTTDPVLEQANRWRKTGADSTTKDTTRDASIRTASDTPPEDSPTPPAAAHTAAKDGQGFAPADSAQRSEDEVPSTGSSHNTPSHAPVAEMETGSSPAANEPLTSKQRQEAEKRERKGEEGDEGGEFSHSRSETPPPPPPPPQEEEEIDVPPPPPYSSNRDSKEEERRDSAAGSTRRGSQASTSGPNSKPKHDFYEPDREDAVCMYAGGRFIVAMYGTQEGKDHDKKYTEYVMRCIWQREDQEVIWLVARRYSEFDRLHNELKLIYGPDAEIFPSLPGKSVFGGRAKAIVEKRKTGLQFYLSRMLALAPQVLNEPEVEQFFRLNVRLGHIINMFIAREREARRALSAKGIAAAPQSALFGGSSTPASPVPTPSPPPARIQPGVINYDAIPPADDVFLTLSSLERLEAASGDLNRRINDLFTRPGGVQAATDGVTQDLLESVLSQIPALKRSVQLDDPRVDVSLVPRALELEEDVRNALNGYASLISLSSM